MSVNVVLAGSSSSSSNGGELHSRLGSYWPPGNPAALEENYFSNERHHRGNVAAAWRCDAMGWAAICMAAKR